MRRVKVRVPEGLGKQVIDIAFAIGLRGAELQRVESFEPNGNTSPCEVVDTETSTPKAKLFIARVLEADFFDRNTCSVISRDARSVFGKDRLDTLTVPLVQPWPDVLEEQWQFSQVTFGFVGRGFLAACLLSLGLIRSQVLLMVAGLLFLPLMPLLFSISFGVVTREFALAKQGLTAFLTVIVLLFLGGAFVALFDSPPVMYSFSNSMLIGFLISLAVGVSAGLAAIDDVGRRELIGLAASSQIALIPALIGIYVMFGAPIHAGWSEVEKHLLSFVLNVLTILVTTGIIFFFSYRKTAVRTS